MPAVNLPTSKTRQRTDAEREPVIAALSHRHGLGATDCQRLEKSVQVDVRVERCGQNSHGRAFGPVPRSKLPIVCTRRLVRRLCQSKVTVAGALSAPKKIASLIHFLNWHDDCVAHLPNATTHATFDTLPRAPFPFARLQRPIRRQFLPDRYVGRQRWPGSLPDERRLDGHGR